MDPEIPVPPKLYGGIERVVDGLIHALRRRGYQVGLVAHSESECPVDYLQPWPAIHANQVIDHLRNTRALMRAVLTFQPDIVHSFSRLGYLVPLLPQRIPKIMSYQRHTGGRQIRIASKLGGRSLMFTGCSEFIAEMGRPWGSHWTSIPNFVDTEFYCFQPVVADDAPLVFLSRIERIKGAHTAIAIARKTGRKLILAGNRVSSGEGAAYWETEIEPFLNKDGIEYIGPVNDKEKNELLGRAAAMIVPIEWDEPFGIVFAEALACGTPVISCPRGALAEIVRPGVEGFLIRDVSEGCRAVEQIGTIERAACRERAVNEFSAAVVSGRYADLYEQRFKEVRLA